MNILSYEVIHSGHFYSPFSSPLLLRGASHYSTDTVSEFHAEAHKQLQVKDLPKVPMSLACMGGDLAPSLGGRKNFRGPE